MKRFILLIGVVFLWVDSFSQQGNYKILMGVSSKNVVKYFDSLNNLKKHRLYKIKKDVDDSGNLLLTVNFLRTDEYFYQCLKIVCLFQRVPQGFEVCTTQRIIGSTKYAENLLAYIKDHFQFVKKGVWTQPYKIEGMYCKALFQREEKDDIFIIDFMLSENKE